jgi:SAM-dependent methyltransferase
MGTLSRFDLAYLVQQTGIHELYETGTGLGGSTRYAAEAGIARIHSVESYEPIHREARQALASFPQIDLVLGDSVDFVRDIAGKHEKPRLFFLDAHFYGGADFKSGDVGAYIESAKDERSFPLEEELALLLAKDVQQDWLIIDDARLYVDGGFGNGACPDWAQQWKRGENLNALLHRLEKTHHVQLLRQDEGYWLCVPKSSSLDWRRIVKVLPGDLPGDPPGTMNLLFDVPGTTSISISRRIADHRFASRYFRGNGIDVGAGNDGLSLFVEFFPQILRVTSYDTRHGDAQTLANVPSAAFDFLYSSHCLAYLRDANEALHHWLRVVKPGGYLVVQVPDEDLYEKGQWPSRYSSDHKLTFTIKKRDSWSPVSVNVLDLLAHFSAQAAILQVQLIDQGYRYGLHASGVDQTRMPLAECGIEFILRKL